MCIIAVSAPLRIEVWPLPVSLGVLQAQGAAAYALFGSAVRSTAECQGWRVPSIDPPCSMLLKWKCKERHNLFENNQSKHGLKALHVHAPES